MPTYAHGRTTRPELKEKWERVKKLVKGKDKEAAMKYSDKGVALPHKANPYAKKKTAGLRLSDFIKKAQSPGPDNVRPADDPRVSCMTCKYFTPISGTRSGPGMCNVGPQPVPVKGTDVSDDYESKIV